MSEQDIFDGDFEIEMNMSGLLSNKDWVKLGEMGKDKTATRMILLLRYPIYS